MEKKVDVAKKEEVKKSLYRISKDPIVIEMNIINDNGILVFNDANLKQVQKERTEQGETPYNKIDRHTVEFVRPWWSLSNKIRSLSMYADIFGAGQRVDVNLLTKNRLLYCLRKCSLFELTFTIDAGGDKIVDNFNELVGENGLESSIIDFMAIAFAEKIG